MGTFAEDITVEPVDAGRYRAELDQSWNLVALPQGGVVAALALRAAEAEVDNPDHQLRTTTTMFAGQVAPGELAIDVQVLRRGRSATQVLATIRNAGADAGATVLAVYGSLRRGPTFVDVTMPEVKAPLDCPSYRDRRPDGVETPEPLPFWGKLEGRAALGHAPWEDYEPTQSDVATWHRFDDPPRLVDGSLDPLAVLTIADRMPGCIGERLGRRGDPWFAPSADLTVHLFEPLHTDWVLTHDRARWADDGWASAETTLWAEDGTLVAYATQMMLFTYLVR